MFVHIWSGKERQYRHLHTNQNESVYCNILTRLITNIDVNMLQFFTVRVESRNFSETTYSTKQH